MKVWKIVFSFTIYLAELSEYIRMPLPLTGLVEIWSISLMLCGRHRKIATTFQERDRETLFKFVFGVDVQISNKFQG